MWNYNVMIITSQRSWIWGKWTDVRYIPCTVELCMHKRLQTCHCRASCRAIHYQLILTLCMLGNFFNYLFLSKFSKHSLFQPIFLADICNLNVKQFGSQMKPHILWGFIWIQIVCKGHQWSSKFTASGLRVKTVYI